MIKMLEKNEMAWNRWFYVRWALAQVAATRNNSSGRGHVLVVLEFHCPHSNHQQPSQLKSQRCQDLGVICRFLCSRCCKAKIQVAADQTLSEASGEHQPLSSFRLSAELTGLWLEGGVPISLGHQPGAMAPSPSLNENGALSPSHTWDLSDFCCIPPACSWRKFSAIALTLLNWTHLGEGGYSSY